MNQEATIKPLSPDAVLHQADFYEEDGQYHVGWENLREALREALRQRDARPAP